MHGWPMLTRHKELLMILLVFALPFVWATHYYWTLTQPGALRTTKTHGHLFAPAEYIEGNFSQKWTLVHAIRSESQRYELWQEQLKKIEIMLGPLSDQVEFKEHDAQLLNLHANWDYDLDQGAILLADRQGYLALGYSYDHEPKKAFIELKKLIKATS